MTSCLHISYMTIILWGNKHFKNTIKLHTPLKFLYIYLECKISATSISVCIKLFSSTIASNSKTIHQMIQRFHWLVKIFVILSWQLKSSTRFNSQFFVNLYIFFIKRLSNIINQDLLDHLIKLYQLPYLCNIVPHSSKFVNFTDLSYFLSKL